jgi:hypothetical protein
LSVDHTQREKLPVATVSAAPAATAAASTTASTAATTSAAMASAAATSAATFPLRTGFVDHERAAEKFLAV